MYKPKATRDIYVESLSVNSASLRKQLLEQSVPADEIQIILGAISKMYNKDVDNIIQECDRDMIALEHVPSPLKLFVDCLGYAQKNIRISSQAHALLERYLSAWEDWM